MLAQLRGMAERGRPAVVRAPRRALGPDHDDEIIYDLAPDKSSASGYGHALCKDKEPAIAEQIHAGFVPRWAKVTK